MTDASGFMNQVVGGWSVNWSSALPGWSADRARLPNAARRRVSAAAPFSPVSLLDLGLHTDASGKLNYFGNPAAFTQPCALDATLTPNRTHRPAAFL